jgi:cytochrome c556
MILASVGPAVANPAAITQRKDILKNFGAVTREPASMLRGDTAFDLAKVKAALAAYRDGSGKLPMLFPDDSFTGDTKALALIGQERDKFNAIFVKLAADATAAESAITNEATFRSEMPKVLGNCGACHNTYRGR